MRSTPYLVLVFVVAGCSKGEPRPATEQASAAPAASSPSTAVAPAETIVPPHSSRPSRELMKDHFRAVVVIRDALVVGNLELAKWNASFLAKHEPDPAVASWSMYVDQLRVRGAKVADAPTLAAATAASTELAVECGRCHAANAVTPVFPTVDRRIAASGARPHMQRHQWAAEQMWDGLIGPSETRWNDGVAELAETPLGQDEIFTNASATPEITKLAADVLPSVRRAARRRAGTSARRSMVGCSRAARHVTRRSRGRDADAVSMSLDITNLSTKCPRKTNSP